MKRRDDILYKVSIDKASFAIVIIGFCLLLALYYYEFGLGNAQTTTYILLPAFSLGYIIFSNLFIEIILFNDSFIIHYPFRLFLRNKKFSYTETIRLLIYDIAYGKTQPSLAVFYKRNTKEKKFTSMYSCNDGELQVFINLLREKNIKVEVKSNSLE